ncbi:MAG: carboxypeptidase-like regulatory domain-containing protein [Hymenobacter sp.]
MRGTVLDAQSQQPLPGVTVVAPGTQAGTTTDASGRFHAGQEPRPARW